MADTKLLVGIDVDDKGTPKLQKFQKSLKDTKGSTDLLGTAMDAAKGKLEAAGIPINKISKSFGGMGTAGLAVAGASVAIGAAMFTMTNAAIGALDALGDLSSQTGVSVEYLSKMRNVVAINNLSMEQFGDGLNIITKNIISNGKELRKLGIDTSDASTAWDSLKKKIAATEDPIEKQRIGQEALGKQYKDFANILNMSQSEYDELISKTGIYTAEQAAMAGKVDDQITILKNSFKDFGVSIGLNLIPVMGKLVEYLQDAADYWGQIGANDTQQQKADELAQALQEFSVERAKRAGTIGSITGTDKSPITVNGQTWEQRVEEINKKYRPQPPPDKKISPDDSKTKTKENDLTPDYLTLSHMEWLQKNSGTELDPIWLPEFMDEIESLQAAWMTWTPEDMATPQAQNVGFFSLPGNDIENAAYQNNSAAGETPEQRAARLKETNAALEEQKRIIDSLGQSIQGSLVSPFDDFYKHIFSGNQSLSDSFNELFANIGASFGNMLIQMLAELTAKAAIFGLLNLLSGGGFGGATSLLSTFKFFANGTDSPLVNTTYARVGERGPEDVILPKGSLVRPANQSNGEAKQITQNNTFVVTGYNGDRIKQELDKTNKRLTASGLI